MENTKYDVVALGELLVDFTENGTSNQGNPIYEANPGGAPCNVLSMLKKLGHETAFIGKIGNDIFGRQLKKAVSDAGIDVSGLVMDDVVKTTLAFVETKPDGDRDFSFYRNPGADMMLQPEEVDAELIKKAKIFHMGTLSLTHEPVRSATRRAVQIAKEEGLMISFDPNIRKELIGEKETDKILENLKRLTNVFLPGEEELLLLTGKETVEEAVEECFKNPELEILALKQGSRGSKIHTKEKTVETGIYRIQPVDATGAGDSFDAAFICGLCEGKRIEEAAKMAAAAGAINTAAFGPMEGKISVEAIDKMIKEE